MGEANTRSSQSADAAGGDAAHAVVDLDRYVPAYFTWIANKLSGGASQAYLAAFDVGIETWRLLVLLAIEGPWSAQRICKVIGMDKASVSRVLKSMHKRGLVSIGLNEQDARLRMATITDAGKQLHDQILGLALARETAFLAVLSPHEQAQLTDFLKRLHDNLPAVEKATAAYLQTQHPQARLRRRHQGL